MTRRFLVALACLSFILPAAVAAGKPQSAAPVDDSLTFLLNENQAFHIVDYLTWCGDCVNGEDVTSQTPYTFQPGSYWPYSDLGLPATPVSSTPGCHWDSDDFWDFHSTGNILAAGATASVQACWYSSYYASPNLFTLFLFRSSSPDLLIREHFEWAGGSHDSPYLVPVPDTANQWRYQQCWLGPVTPLGTVVEIPDSHGGMALPVRVTLTVANPTSRKVSKAYGFWTSDYRDNGLYCQPYPIPVMP